MYIESIIWNVSKIRYHSYQLVPLLQHEGMNTDLSSLKRFRTLFFQKYRLLIYCYMNEPTNKRA
jgi:hypothetical protein